MTRPRRGESPADLAARVVRREHRAPRAWPPVIGGLLCVAGFAAWAFADSLPPPAETAGAAAWWGGIGCGVLGGLACRGGNQLASVLLVASALALTAWSVRGG